MRRGLLILALAAVPLLSVGGAAAAPNVESLGVFEDWAAFTYVDKGNRICFVQSRPKESLPKNVRRGPIHALVTHRPAEKATDVVSLLMGYPLRPKSEVKVDIDGSDFALFVEGETAWARDARTDTAIANAMIKGRSMEVKGVSTRGTNTTDKYSLNGFTAAIEAASKSCDVKR